MEVKFWWAVLVVCASLCDDLESEDEGFRLNRNDPRYIPTHPYDKNMIARKWLGKHKFALWSHVFDLTDLTTGKEGKFRWIDYDAMVAKYPVDDIAHQSWKYPLVGAEMIPECAGSKECPSRACSSEGRLGRAARRGA